MKKGKIHFSRMLRFLLAAVLAAALVLTCGCDGDSEPGRQAVELRDTVWLVGDTPCVFLGGDIFEVVLGDGQSLRGTYIWDGFDGYAELDGKTFILTTEDDGLLYIEDGLLSSIMVYVGKTEE